MSRICEKCGALIPDGVEICPTCGGGKFDTMALRDVLGDLGISMDSEADPKSQATSEPPEAPEAPEAQAEPESLESGKLTPQAEEASQTPKEKQAAPAETPARKTRPAARTANSGKAAAQRQTGKPRTRQSTARTAAGSKRRRPAEEPEDTMKKSSAAIIGVVIGLLVALLLFVGVGAFLLYRMGFFEPMTEDELLGTVQHASTEQVVTAAPNPSPSPSPSPSPEATPSPEPSPSPSPELLNVERFELTGSSSLTLFFRGETAQLEFEIEPAEAADQIQWSSDNALVADVTELGVVQARRGGSCNITGDAGNMSITVAVTCDFDVPDTVLDMNMEDITMDHEGQTVSLEIDYDLPEDYVNATIWESSDPEVAVVDQHGVVTAVADGTAVITASIANYTASCIVRCVNVTGNKGFNSDSSEYVVNYEDVTLTRKGEYFQLSLSSVLGRSMPAYTWESDDPSVATVDEKGVVTAVSNGVANITTTVGEDQFRCVVRVNLN